MRLVNFLKEAQSIENFPTTSHKSIIGSLKEAVTDLNLPITVKSSTWIVQDHPERLSKTFSFDRYNHMLYFLEELLSYQESSNHHSKITIDHRYVTIESYTKDFDGITSQDKNLAKFCDEIYSDVSFLRDRE